MRNNLNNKYIIKADGKNNYKENNRIIKTEGNKKISPINKSRSASNSKSHNNRNNTPSPRNKGYNITKNIFNQKILEIIRYTEEELGSLDSEKNIQNSVKILENFQKELIEKLEQKYDEKSIKRVLLTNFEKIINMLSKYFTLYDKNCSNCIINLKQMIKNLLNTNLKIYENNNNINIEDISSYNNNISYIDEDKKKDFLNGEEIIVGLINSLSGGIKTFNKNYRSKIYDMAKLIEELNNGLIELKNRFDQLSNQLKSNYVKDLQYKKNINLFLDNISNDVENLYSMNVNIIEDVKLLDSYQTSFYDDAKKIFNNLKINHSKKLKEFHLLFQSIKKRGKSISSTKNKSKNLLDEQNNDEKTDGRYSNDNKMNRNNSSKNFNIKNNYNEKMNNISEYLKINDNNITIYSLAEQMLEFFNKMKNLQECIVKKISGTNQMKMDFERYKKKLIKLLNNIINNKNKISINSKNSINKINDINDNDAMVIKNRNNNNLISNQIIKTKNQIDNKIIQVEKFQIISNNNKNNGIKNKNEEVSNELQKKYNNVLEEINNKSQEINKLQDKINKLLLEKNELNSKNKKLDKDNQVLLSKINNINNSDKNNKQNNINEFEKVNIDDILSSSNNINNHSINSNHELFKLTDYEVKLKQENKNLKDLMNKCMHIIFESIKEASPNMVEDNLSNEELIDNIKINKSNNQKDEEEEEFDVEYINEAVKKFQTFNEEISKNLKKLKEEKEKYEKEAHENLVKAEAYKNALDQAINKINIEDGNNADINEKNNKRKLTFDEEGELSFKGNFENNINNNIYNKEEKLIKKSNNKENNINEEINKYIIESNNEENNNNNDAKNIDNENANNEDVNKVNRDLLKVQQNLIEKIKLLEEEIEKNKTTIHNLFIESGNDLYDINEMTVSMTKYNRLLKLLETEQERNKNLEEKYISFINEITENLSINNYYANISDKLKTNINKNENNKIDDENENI